MSYFEWRDYVSVAEKRRSAEREIAKLRKRGRSIAPVVIEGRTIAKSFWGGSWCVNLERYSDYESRLPRGRSYVRNGFVVDLQIAKGKVSALVSGSELYEVGITIAPVAPKRWQAICRDCAGSIDSLVELLQGRLAKGVMDRVCREGDGLFPAPNEIKLACSCPDWADMCKHVAAVLYGVGARLDEKPQLLFVLRGVDENELLAGAGQDLAISKSTPAATKVLADNDVAALFGLEMAESITSGVPVADAPKPSRRTKTIAGGKTSPTKAPAAKNRDDGFPRNSRSKVGSRRAAKVRAGKRARTPT
jgi:uncharacterized Zn finger protein